MPINCKNDYTVPTFMDTHFFDQSLQKGFDDPSLKVTNFTVTGGTKPGQNYCSQILRVSVTYCSAENPTSTVGLIVKFLDNDELAALVKENGMFPKENEIYTRVLPVLKDMLDGEDIAPRFFYYTEEPTQCIIFQDVCKLGFRLADAPTGLDEAHCELVLRKLGKFHAASVIFAANNPYIYENINNVSAIIKSHPPPNVVLNNIRHLAGLVATWHGYEHFSPKLERFLELIDNNLNVFNAPNTIGLNVLAHIDLWNNNILFKYNEDGKPNGVLLIDFQLSHYTSPGVDLMHFLYTSAAQDVLQNKLADLVERYYYDTFRKALHHFNFECIPSFKDIHESMMQCTSIGFVWTMMQRVVSLSGSLNAEVSLRTLDDPDKGAEWRNLVMNSPDFVSCMKCILLQMEEAGVFQ